MRKLFSPLLLFLISSVAVAQCPEDITGDEIVSQFDLNTLYIKFGTTCTVTVCPSDINGDGVTSQADLNLLYVKFGTTCKPTEYAIPKKKLDDGFSEVINGNGLLYFTYNEEYLGGTLQFKVYNSSRDIKISNTLNATAINSTTKNLGNNKYSINCQLPVRLTSGYYILEITNDKNEVVKLRFHIS